ncbi:hypothetical protein GDO78_015886 [Eleutherodactylus coqui]|uniref:Uncharacterized protein n=1 Tax=Eleutherodactylus coqui TaxID=57060 RepID=A0A8J6ED47_ELECQ|nr:hypothetical protein GDO78_015886 [Eleutherodactylus coqui]
MCRSSVLSLGLCSKTWFGVGLRRCRAPSPPQQKCFLLASLHVCDTSCTMLCHRLGLNLELLRSSAEPNSPSVVLAVSSPPPPPPPLIHPHPLPSCSASTPNL